MKRKFEHSITSDFGRYFVFNDRRLFVVFFLTFLTLLTFLTFQTYLTNQTPIFESIPILTFSNSHDDIYPLFTNLPKISEILKLVSTVKEWVKKKQWGWIWKEKIEKISCTCFKIFIYEVKCTEHKKNMYLLHFFLFHTWKVSREETSIHGLENNNLQKSIPGPFKCFWAFCLGIFYFLFFFIWKLAQENLGSSDYSSSDGEESFPQLSKQANKKFKAVGSDIEEGDEEHEEEGDEEHEEKDEEEDEEEDEEKNAENSGQSEGEMEKKAKPKRKTKEKSKRNSKEKSKEKSKPKEQKSKHSTNKNSKHSTKKSKSKK